MERWFVGVMMCTFDQALIFLQKKNNHIITAILFFCFFFHLTIAAVGWSLKKHC